MPVTHPVLALIVAAAENNVIGNANRLPWHLPADLQHFKALTLGKPILMGRKTYQSIGKALPGRRNLVLTRDRSFKADGVEIVTSLEAALDATAGTSELMVIGGSEIYKLCLPQAQRIYLTRVHACIPGDTPFPHCDWQEWREVLHERRAADEKNIHPMSFITLERAQSI